MEGMWLMISLCRSSLGIRLCRRGKIIYIIAEIHSALPLVASYYCITRVRASPK